MISAYNANCKHDEIIIFIGITQPSQEGGGMLTFLLQPYSRVNMENPYPILDLFPDLLMLTGLNLITLSYCPLYRFLSVIYWETFSD